MNLRSKYYSDMELELVKTITQAIGQAQVRTVESQYIDKYTVKTEYIDTLREEFGKLQLDGKISKYKIYDDCIDIYVKDDITRIDFTKEVFDFLLKKHLEMYE